MNAKRKESAVKKYAGKFENEQELIDAVKADEKAYTEEEVQEIVEAIQAGSDGSNGDDDPKVGELAQFECWKAKPRYKWGIDEATGDKVKTLEGVDKVGDKPTMVTSIEQRHADELNAQVENSGLYYFPTKK